MAKKKEQKNNLYLPPVGTATGTMQRVMDQVLVSKESPIDLRELAIGFMKSIGGPDGFVELMMADYRCAKPGSPERARFWEMLMKLWGIVTEKETPVDGDLASDKDLEIAAANLMKKMTAK